MNVEGDACIHYSGFHHVALVCLYGTIILYSTKTCNYYISTENATLGDKLPVLLLLQLPPSEPQSPWD